MSKQVRLSEIRVGDNIRDARSTDLTELKESILAVHKISSGEKTLVHPVTVRKLPKKDGQFKYELRYGYRRFAAFEELLAEHPKKCHWASTLPCNIDAFTDDELAGADVAYRLIENIHRADMNSIDEARAIRRLIDEGGVKQTDAAGMLGKSKGWVSQRLKLLTLDPVVQAAVAEDIIKPTEARELGKVKDPKKQRAALKETVAAKKEGATATQAAKAAVKDKLPESAKTETRGRPAKEGVDLSTLSHEEKLQVLRKRKAKKDARGKKPVAPVWTQNEAKEKEAKEQEDPMKAAFYAGVVQGMKVALGERKSVAYNARSYQPKGD